MTHKRDLKKLSKKLDRLKKGNKAQRREYYRIEGAIRKLSR